MDTPTKPGTGVTVAKQEQEIEAGRLLQLAQGRDERVQVWETMTAVRQGRVIREASETIGEFAWGAKLSPLHRAALARFAYAMGTDPVRHWSVLGNSVYDKAELWLDLVTSEPDYHHHEIQHINDDKRLGEEKRAARAELRAEWNMPDTAGVCIVTIVVKRHDELIAFSDANHAGNRQGFNARTGAEGLIKDPIGEQDPGKTAMTRAFRRAAKKCYPLWRFKRDIPKDEGMNVAELARDDLQTSIAHERDEAKRLETGNPKLDGKRELLTVAGTDGMKMVSTHGDRLPPESVYGVDVPPVEGIDPAAIADPYEPKIVKTGEIDPVEGLAHGDGADGAGYPHADRPDADDDQDGEEPTAVKKVAHEPSQDQEPPLWTEARKRGGPHAVELPWGPTKGTPIGVLSTDHLGRLLKWIRSGERDPDFLARSEQLLDAIGNVLEDRRQEDVDPAREALTPPEREPGDEPPEPTDAEKNDPSSGAYQ